MASTSEVGHAKNIANLKALNIKIAALGNIYQPTNPKIKLQSLQTLYTKAFDDQELVNNTLPPYTFAVNARQAIFNPLSKELTKLRKAFKATEGVDKAKLDDLMTIIRKLKGDSKRPSNATTTGENQDSHSTSQLSYDQRTNTMAMLIAFLQNTPNYNPNEDEFKIATLQAKRESMLEATEAVNVAFAPLSNARNVRNQTLYTSPDNLVDTAQAAKYYIASILDTSSVQYKDIARIQFRKR